MNKVLLLSIRPVFAELIYSGKKRVELRRLRLSVSSGDLVLVYMGTLLVVGSQSQPSMVWSRVAWRLASRGILFPGLTFPVLTGDGC